METGRLPAQASHAPVQSPVRARRDRSPNKDWRAGFLSTGDKSNSAALPRRCRVAGRRCGLADAPCRAAPSACVWKPCVRRLRGRGSARRLLVHSAAQPETSHCARHPEAGVHVDSCAARAVATQTPPQTKPRFVLTCDLRLNLLIRTHPLAHPLRQSAGFKCRFQLQPPPARRGCCMATVTCTARVCSIQIDLLNLLHHRTSTACPIQSRYALSQQPY